MLFTGVVVVVVRESLIIKEGISEKVLLLRLKNVIMLNICHIH
jgi:hypothetical protein